MKRRLHYRTLWDKANRTLKYVGLAWRAASLALAMMLTCAPIAHALIVEGDDPPPQCSLSASLSASPSVIDRNAYPPKLNSTVTWAVTVPPQCTMTLGLYLTGKGPVGKSGQLSLEVLQTTTYALKALFLPGQPTLASATVTVSGDPGLITVSPGPSLTAADLAEFNAQHMQPYQRNIALARAHGNLYRQNPGIVWEVSERMEAMVRMYDLTQDIYYLDHLKEFIELALLYRDDYHPGPVSCTPPQCPPPSETPWWKPFDSFRWQAGMPAWGARSIITGGLHSIDEVSFGLAYPIAAFARIVAEDSALHSRYSAAALRYTNDMIKTVQVFFPQIDFRQAGSFTEASLTGLSTYSHTPTPTQCDNAYAQALADAPGADAATKERYANWKKACLDLHHAAGVDMAHNWNQWYIMGLIELWKALDSPWYRNHPNADPTAGLLRTYLPLLVSRLHRNFVNRLETVGSGDTARFFWHYNDGLPDAIPTYDEDTSHGALDMRGLEVLRANFDRLNAAVTAAGEPIVLDSTHLRRFANTFLQKIAVGSNFAEDVLGNTADPVDKYNFTCDGWANLAVADVRVYHKCHEVSLRVVNGKQPYLSIGNHSALLMNKRWLPANPPPPPPPPPPPFQCRSGLQCCEDDPDGGCALCYPLSRPCP